MAQPPVRYSLRERSPSPSNLGEEWDHIIRPSVLLATTAPPRVTTTSAV